MQNNRRQFYIFDLELAARKAGATIPTMNDIVPVLQRMKDTARTYSLRSNTATMLIGDMAVNAAQQFVTLLVRLSDTTTVHGGDKVCHWNAGVVLSVAV